MPNDKVFAKLEELIRTVEDLRDEGGIGTASSPLPFQGAGAASSFAGAGDWPADAVSQIVGAPFDPTNITGFLSALENAFPIKADDAGHIVAQYAPGSGAQSMPSGLGARAGVAALAKIVANQAIPLIQTLKPLSGRRDCKDYKTLVPLITKALDEVAAFAQRPGGASLPLIKNRLSTLMGPIASSGCPIVDGSSVQGSLGALGERLGMAECSPTSIMQEGTLNDYNTAVVLVGMLASAFQNENAGTLCGDGHLGTQVYHIQSNLAHIREQLQRLKRLISGADLAAFVLSPRDRTTLADFFAWIENLASPKTVEAINASGNDYIAFDFLPTVENILEMFDEIPLPDEDADDDDETTGDIDRGAEARPDDDSESAEQYDKDCGIAALLERRSVRRVFSQLRCDLRAVKTLANSIRYCAPVSVTDVHFYTDEAYDAEIFSAPPGATIRAQILGRNFRAESEANLFGPDGGSVRGDILQCGPEEIRAKFVIGRDTPLGRWDIAVVTDECCVAKLTGRLVIDQARTSSATGTLPSTKSGRKRTYSRK